ncbi:NAD(P)/FAD-dependent oxidoreductase [Luteolibacter sp. AS25]|uniref:NAD(P)/FAD-dependent oxidoreductase n=1 Tax=Luteolibacter sp. AS25 TaxID=3135776 RepID=UPI00398A8BC7
MTKETDTVAIIGAGPAGCTLACLLAMRGINTVVFDDDKRPALLVGESLIPAVIPILRKLEIEDRVREFSVYKPGASFFHGGGSRLHFKFRDRGAKAPAYAYNVPRPEFDNLLRTRATELGVTFVGQRAKLLKSDHPDRDLELSAKSLALANLRVHPKWLIDGTGRARLFARTLDLPAQCGTRKDAAYFAHFENFDHDEVDPGQIIISVLENGWSWRIPLQGKLSVGIVIDKESAKKLGNTPEQRLENAISIEPLLQEKGKNARRITEVMTYTNYQLIGHQGHGKGWIMLGDAFGFVDPMLSPGLFMALESASLLDSLVFSKSKPTAANLDSYCAELKNWHSSWQELIDYFYDGRILRLYEAGSQLAANKGPLNPAKLIEKHMSRVIANMATGVGTRSRYNRNLLKHSSKHCVWGVKEAEYYAVK